MYSHCKWNRGLGGGIPKSTCIGQANDPARESRSHIWMGHFEKRMLRRNPGYRAPWLSWSVSTGCRERRSSDGLRQRVSQWHSCRRFLEQGPQLSKRPCYGWGVQGQGHPRYAWYVLVSFADGLDLTRSRSCRWSAWSYCC